MEGGSDLTVPLQFTWPAVLVGVSKQHGETQGHTDLRSVLAERFIGQSHSSLSLPEEGETGVRLRQQQLTLS